MSEEINTNQCIHIGTGFDRNYLNGFLALVGSLLKHHRGGMFELHVITDGLSLDEKRKIRERVLNSGHRLTFYEVEPSLVKQFVTLGQWTSVVYYRLYFSMLIQKPIRRLLYLDCDTITINSLWSLYTVDLEDHPVGAVYDNYVKTQPYIGIITEGDYFNSGVLVIDLEKWRDEKISERCFTYLLNHPERILYLDQCALNAVLKNNWKKLEHRYNLMYSLLPEGMGRNQMEQVLKDGVVVHFTLQRPWNMLCRNRLRKLYFRNLRHYGINLPSWGRYTDFKIRKIPAWLTIRLQEFYFDSPWIQRIWRALPTK